MARLPEFKVPQVLAHRMMVMGYPENTLLSFGKVCELGVDWIEFDVKVLKDGTMISMHDNTVDRTTDGHGVVTDMTWDEVSKLNAGKGYPFGFVPVPRVEEILKALSECPNFIRAEMHIHNLWEPERLIPLLEKYGVMDRCYLNLNAVILAEHIREDVGNDEVLLSLNVNGPDKSLKKICNDLDISYLCIPPKALTEEFIDEIHSFRDENPVFVQCYPVNGEDEWERMIDIGVDVIQTDYPEVLMEYIREKFEKVGD